jgi:hypothetical protein
VKSEELRDYPLLALRSSLSVKMPQKIISVKNIGSEKVDFI